jgi:predicted acyltransferase
MNNPSATSAIFEIIFLFAMGLPLAVTANKLAKEKGRNVTLWTILALIPIVNFLCMWFFVGAANLKMEKKIDALLNRLGHQP